MKISEIITDKYKLRIPPTVYYELLADVREVEEEQEPTTKTCKTCRNYGSHNGVCDICKDYNCFTEPNKSEILTSSDNLSSGTRKNTQKLEKGTTKNNLVVDWESYKDVDGNSLDDLILEVLQNNFDCGNTYGYKVADEIIGLLPSVTPQEPFINKPCVSNGVCEHDKNKVLDKIIAEIKALSPEPTAYDVVDGNPIKDAVWETLADVLQIIDKYKGESEDI